MDGPVFDAWTRRRFGLAGVGAAAAHLGLARGDDAEAKKKKKKTCKDCCRENASACNKKSTTCKKKFCLNAPFTIEANWTVSADHDTYLFVPKENDLTGSSPYIGYLCEADATTPCDTQYPLACGSGDEQSSGSEVTTIYQLLKGTYEYWVELSGTALAKGDLTIVLRDQNGRSVRAWQNPANPSALERGWHVFDIDGRTGSVNSIDGLIDLGVPNGAHDPNTNVCP